MPDRSQLDAKEGTTWMLRREPVGCQEGSQLDAKEGASWMPSVGCQGTPRRGDARKPGTNRRVLDALSESSNQIGARMPGAMKPAG